MKPIAILGLVLIVLGIGACSQPYQLDETKRS